MGNKLRRMFNLTAEYCEPYKEMYREVAEKRGCSTCRYRKRVRNYPGFAMGEECECDAGLECDTVLFSVENCRKWEGFEGWVE